MLNPYPATSPRPHLLRRTAFRHLVAVLVLLSIALTVPLSTSGDGAYAASGYDEVVDITFPVADHQRFMNDFYHARSGGRTHQATDIMTVYGEPVFAAVGGTIHRAWGIDGNPPSWGYAIYLHGDDGRTYVYIHLGRQDGPPSEAFAPGIANGVRVQRGQHIGYAGHSGNASVHAPHLHFEIHDPNITNPFGESRMNPYASLVAALGRGDLPSATRFRDVSLGATHRVGIEYIAEKGITRGCNPPANDRFCPRDAVSRGQMAAFLGRKLSLQVTNGQRFSDVPSSHTFEGDIDRLATAGITRGCNPPANDRFCPDRPVSRDQMAAFMVRALGLTETSGVRFRDVPRGSTFETDIDKLATAGITRGCNPPANDRFCPGDPVTREQMATFIQRASTR